MKINLENVICYTTKKETKQYRTILYYMLYNEELKNYIIGIILHEKLKFPSIILYEKILPIN